MARIPQKDLERRKLVRLRAPASRSGKVCLPYRHLLQHDRMVDQGPDARLSYQTCTKIEERCYDRQKHAHGKTKEGSSPGKDLTMPCSRLPARELQRIGK